MSGIEAISSRIQAIEQRVTQPPVLTGGVGGSAFAAHLQAATATRVQATAVVDASFGQIPISTTAAIAGRARMSDAELREIYPNGEIPASALVPISGTDEMLAPEAAQAFQALRQAAAADGVSFGVTDGYRSIEDQHYLADELGLYGQGGWAAVPGTSDHGWGRAVDLDLNAEAQAWMRTHAGEFGYYENVPGEPWHWTYLP